MNWTRHLISLALLLALLIPTSLYGITGLGLGVKAGIVTDFNNPNLKINKYKFDDLKDFGGFVKFGRQSFALELGIETFSDKANITLFDQVVKAETKDFMVTATAKFFFKFPIIQPFIGGGIGSHRFTYTYKGPLGQYQGIEITVPADETHFGLHGVAGLKTSIPAFPFDLFLEAKLGRVSTSGDDVKYTIIAIGAIFNLP